MCFRESKCRVIVLGQNYHHANDHIQKYTKHEKILNSRNDICLMWSTATSNGISDLVREVSRIATTLPEDMQQEEAYPRAHSIGVAFR